MKIKNKSLEWFFGNPSMLHRKQPPLATIWNRIVVIVRIAQHIDDVENVLRQVAYGEPTLFSAAYGASTEASRRLVTSARAVIGI